MENQLVEDDVQVTSFSEKIHDLMIHFQIIKLQRQIFLWIGCNSAKIGNLHVTTSTRPNNTVSVTTLLGSGAKDGGSSIARHLAFKSGLSIVVACDLPKDSPMLELAVERKVVDKLKNLGYIKAKQEAYKSASSSLGSS